MFINSSEIPSEKYSCSTSELMLTNGKTAIESLGTGTAVMIIDTSAGSLGWEPSNARVSQAQQNIHTFGLYAALVVSTNEAAFEWMDRPVSESEAAA
jgi:hypothetical protein